VIGVICLANEVADDLHFIAIGANDATFAGDQQQALSGGAHLSIARNSLRHHIKSFGGSFASSASTCCSIITP
jgi:hypothetical protein